MVAITSEGKGAWVDGKYYNLTWVESASPYFDENGKLVQSEFNLPAHIGCKVCRYSTDMSMAT